MLNFCFLDTTVLQRFKCVYVYAMQYSCLLMIAENGMCHLVPVLHFPPSLPWKIFLCWKRHTFSSLWRLNPKQGKNSDLLNMKYGRIVIMSLLILVAVLWIPSRYEKSFYVVCLKVNLVCSKSDSFWNMCFLLGFKVWSDFPPPHAPQSTVDWNSS